MTLVQLRHFVALADAGSYVQAAKAVFLTQPALTRSILSLEDELGGKLFDRLGRRIALTQFGAEILQRASRLVGDAESLKQAGKWMHEGLVGQLRIGLSSAPGAMYSTPLMLYMAQHHPKLHVQISRANTGVLVDALREQRLDAAIVDLRSMRPAADLLVTQSFELAAGFQARPQHPLVQLGRPVSLAEIMAYPMASTPLSDEVARVLIARYGPVANPDNMVTLHCDETLSIVDLARQSDVILLTVNAVAADLVRLNVSPALNATGRFGLVTLTHHQEAPALRIVREQLAVWGSA
jgi:DNA-binding transcriptional LysR family regulator